MTEMAFISRLSVPSRIGPYAVHERVYGIFPNRPVYRRNLDQVLVISKDPPPSNVDSKPYSPQIVEGETLRFVMFSDVSKSRFTRGSRGERFDPIAEAKLADADRTYQEIAEALAPDWLQRKGKNHGFDPVDISKMDYKQTRFVRPRDGQSLRFTVIDFEGVLVVTDKEKFTDCLISGIGRGKAFGLGALLVRRI